MRFPPALLGALLLTIVAPSAGRQVTSPPPNQITNAAPRRVWTVPVEASFWGPVSADGRFIVFGSRDDGEIYVHDFKTGSNRRLTSTASPGGPNGEVSEGHGADVGGVMSPDGTQSAYSWRIGNRETLRVVRLTGSGIQSPRVLVAEPDIDWIYPEGWSPDGMQVGFRLSRRNRPGFQLGIASTVDGTVRVVKSSDRDDDPLRGVFFSPDGRYFAYTYARDGGGGTDISLVSTASRQEAVVTFDQGDYKVVAWLDAALVLAREDSDSGSIALFVLPVENGKTGELRRVTADLPGIEPVGMSASGSFYYRVRPSVSWRSSIASIDFATGQVSVRPVTVAPAVSGANLFPASWSRDGKRLALVAQQQGPRVMYIRSTETGELRAVPQQLTAFQGADLSPDGRAVATIGTDKTRRRGLFVVDLQTGAATLAAERAELFRAWSADGTKVYFDRPIDDGAGDVAIVEHEVTTGAERDVHRASGQWAARVERAMSADGKVLYYLTPELAKAQPQSLVAQDIASGKDTTLVRDRILGAVTLSPGGQFLVTSIDAVLSLVPTAGGAPRPVPSVGGVVPTIVAWAPDGGSFLGRTTVGADSAHQTTTSWWVPVDGRPARKLDLTLGSNASAISSGGSTVAFVGRIGPANPPAEIWVLDGVIPPNRPRRD
jgi:Tol biopolymer transport system component